MLSGRVSLVTGAASGIGRAVAQRLRAEGSSVVLLDRNADELAKASDIVSGSPSPAGEDARVVAMPLDVAVASEVQSVVARVQSEFGRIDSLVQSAGITRDRRLFALKEEDWDAVVDVNMKGTFLCAQAVAAAMEANNIQGSIVNVSSIVAKVGNFGQTNYTAAKCGVIGMTKTLAKELGKSQIRCNVILPGFIKTPMTEVIPEKVQKITLSQIPLGRQGEPEDIANMAKFLVSDESSYITGGIFEVTGGLGM